MRLKIRPELFLDEYQGKPYPLARGLALLMEIEHSGNLRAACSTMSMSYRSAWDLLLDMEKAVGGPLVEMTRGKGSSLTELGKRLILAQRLVHARFDPLLDSMAAEIDSEIQSVITRAQKNLKIFASHGFVVAAINTHLQRLSAPVEISYRGSLESLQALNRGTCDIAGFHVPIGKLEANVLEQFRKLFKPTHAVIHVATRRLGLIVRKDNPKNIWSIRDLLRPEVVMVNRQQGSGTRLIFELLLKDENCSGQSIAGFENVELTHAAIAAYIASGKADVGLGVETAARQFDLDFVPILTERYCFLCENATLEDPRFGEALELIQSTKFHAEISKLPGYDASFTGVVADIGTAFPATSW